MRAGDDVQYDVAAFRDAKQFLESFTTFSTHTSSTLGTEFWYELLYPEGVALLAGDSTEYIVSRRIPKIIKGLNGDILVPQR